MLKEYLNNIQGSIDQGDAREESYYIHLDNLIRNFATENKIKKIDITILPKKTEAGNPDFRVWDGRNHIIGYIEAKNPSVTDLDRIEESDQLKRYRNTFPNVILTNFYEFRLYRDGELIKKTSIGQSVIAKKLKVTPPVENETGFNDLLNTFFSFSLPHVRNAKALALELAKRTRFLRDEVISIEIAEEGRKGKKAILGFYEAFKKYLIGTLTEQTFADLYSQTITYGLFAARSRSDNSFNRELAFKYIPDTIGILRDVFRFISLEEPPKPLQIIVDDIAEVLNVTDVNKILQDYYREGKGKDPIIHFYETFLTAYDQTIRDKRGVYYTPEPGVGFIVRSVNRILKTHFNVSDGLAGENVALLDPAAGTMTFPAEAIKLAVNEFTEKYGKGGKIKLIRNQILKNFYAFELMMASYAIGHLKISFLFEEIGYRLGDDERFKLYLTNTLEMEDLEQIQIPGLSSLSEESHLAGKVKKEQPVLVILGNPPYSGISSNPGEFEKSFKKGEKYVVDYFWNPDKNCVDKKYSPKLTKEFRKKQKTFIGDLLMDYYFIDGNPLGEKKLWLQDDYVKFIRFAQWKIQQIGYGIVGMITNHSYLDNPTFRGMRQSLMNTFNEIYILDLHGNSLKKEICPNGSKDENVFDIRQGTAIALFIKLKDKKSCNVYHSEQFGVQEAKYKWLDSNNFIPKIYKKLEPESPWYFFIPRDTAKIANYLNWFQLTDIFPVNNVGIVTARDHFAIDFDLNPLKNRIRQFRDLKVDESLITEAYKLKDTSTFKLTKSRNELAKEDNWEENIRQISYRPFDIRYIFYSKWVVERPIYDTMRNMLDNNIGIVARRQQLPDRLCNYFFISPRIISDGLIRSDNKGSESLFPLYLYKEKKSKKSYIQSMILFEPEASYGSTSEKVSNIDKTIYEKLNKTYKKKLTPEEILYYIYAVFYSNIYREKYSEFLKIDFPRVPFTADYSIFSKMVKLGNKLVNLHLMKSDLLDNPISKYHGNLENDRIEKVIYNEKEQRIYINKDKYFDNVSVEIWNYQIGGYQVLQKYLKTRKNRVMEDSRYYCRIITALSNTIGLQKQIDDIYLAVEKELIDR
ncbi:MAG: DNA methyltransferase [Bacteroidetes bacterium]|nr:DNA methyltransferase [Bacteroidota bacterium]